MEKRISVVIPNYNDSATIGKCLEAAFASRYGNFEVIVVDDKSEDNSVEIIKKFPCKLLQLERHSGASKARNTGALNSSGEIIFFTDADCLLEEDTLTIINRTVMSYGDNGKVIIGGTYAKMSYDQNFYSTFQSAFVNYSETRTPCPDYIAAHAMVISAEAFKQSDGFPEAFLPIIEDVEFTHRLKRSGVKLAVNPDIQVRHIFGFTFLKSMRNAFKKTKYWVMYSLKNKDLFADSGSASTGLKANVALYALSVLCIIARIIFREPAFLYPLPLFFTLNTVLNRGLLQTFYETDGVLFAVPAFLHYTFLYPIPVGAGTVAGMIEYFISKRRLYLPILISFLICGTCG